ncbi:MAG: 50S ribosomal protein L31e [Candidatus Pacearchaeota archaeon]
MTEENIILEREYIVNLRKYWIKKAYYKRINAAIKGLKKFVARHMRVEDRDIKKVKLDKWLNVEIWKRSRKKPPAKIKIKAKKLDSGIVKVELAEIPEYWKYRIEKEKKILEEGEKIRKEKEEKKKELEEKAKEELRKAEEEAKEEIEKEKAEEIAKIEEAKEKHKEIKHEAKVSKIKKQPVTRKALQK